MRPKPRLRPEIIETYKKMLGKCPLCGFLRRVIR